ncbi:ATP-binding protein [Streptomyces alboverticillatus]|uniref:ATP-binding protein n=1 Tax=Streptomyces TaxID=1883 RepID=UPI003CCBDFCD
MVAASWRTRRIQASWTTSSASACEPSTRYATARSRSRWASNASVTRPGGWASTHKQANLPTGKTFDSWQEEESSHPLPTQHALMTLEWVGRAENLAIAGPSGTGKSHFAEALAHKAIDQGMQVAWFSLESLTAHVGRATVDNSVAKAIAKITRAHLIILDDIGMLPSGQAAAEAFYRVIDAAYERRSVIVTSNLHPSGFDTIMPKTLATAAVDRLLHHAHIVLTEGTSLRLTQATTGKGVKPLH